MITIKTLPVILRHKAGKVESTAHCADSAFEDPVCVLFYVTGETSIENKIKYPDIKKKIIF